LETDREEWRSEEARIAGHLVETRRSLETLDAEAAQAGRELAALSDQLRETAAELKEATAGRDRLANELTAARARRQALAELAASFQGYTEGARSVLAASRRGSLPPGFQPVLEALRVPAGLEAAVEAA